MKKLLFFLPILSLFLLLPKTFADNRVNFTVTQDPNPVYANSGTLKLTLNDPKGDLNPNNKYIFAGRNSDGSPVYGETLDPTKVYTQDQINNIPVKVTILDSSTAEIDINLDKASYKTGTTTTYNFYYNSINDANLLFTGQFTVNPLGGQNGEPQLKFEQNAYQAGSKMWIDLINIETGKNYVVWWDGSKVETVYNGSFSQGDLFQVDGFPTVKLHPTAPSSTGIKKLCMDQTTPKGVGPINTGAAKLTCRVWSTINITALQPNEQELNTPVTTSNDPGIPTDTGSQVAADTPTPLPPPCPSEAYNSVTGQCDFVNTGIPGLTIKTDPAGFVQSVFGLLLSISGGVALLLIIYSGYQMMMSHGKPETIQAARDRLTSAIVGLLFIIFSLVILQAIGVNILHLPGFS